MAIITSAVTPLARLSVAVEAQVAGGTSASTVARETAASSGRKRLDFNRMRRNSGIRTGPVCARVGAGGLTGIKHAVSPPRGHTGAPPRRQ